MAKRSKRTTQVQNKLVEKFEPVVKDEVLEHNARYACVLNWYNCFATHEHAMEWLCDYLKTVPDKFPDGVSKIKQVPKPWINLTAAWISRLVMRGAKVPDSSWNFLHSKIEDMFKHIKDITPEVANNTITVSVQDRVRNKAGEIIAELEGMIDDKNSDFMGLLRQNEVSATVAFKVLEHFQPILAELADAITGDDENIKEGYSRNDADELLEIAATYQGLVELLDNYVGNVKKARAPRKRKPLTAAKLLKHFTYCEKYDEKHLVSINPERILGAGELWTFNTRNNILAVYRALDKSGLSVKRSCIAKYDENLSIAKRIGRKTEERIKTVQEGGKVALRKLMDDISGEALPVPRINEATILLRAS